MTELILDATMKRKAERYDRSRLSRIAYGNREAVRLRECAKKFAAVVQNAG